MPWIYSTTITEVRSTIGSIHLLRKRLRILVVLAAATRMRAYGGKHHRMESSLAACRYPNSSGGGEEGVKLTGVTEKKKREK